MKRLTLIGGAPLTGKTTLSKKLAREYHGATVVSTDDVRSWMKQVGDPWEYPGLFYTDGMSAEEFYRKYDTPRSVIVGEIAEGVQVEKGPRALLNVRLGWKHLVIEGIAVTPEFIIKVQQGYPDLEVEGIVLVDENKQRIHDRISGRGLWGPLDTYPSSLIPEEVEWVVLYNRWFREQAERYGVDISILDYN